MDEQVFACVFAARVTLSSDPASDLLCPRLAGAMTGIVFAKCKCLL